MRIAKLIQIDGARIGDLEMPEHEAQYPAQFLQVEIDGESRIFRLRDQSALVYDQCVVVDARPWVFHKTSFLMAE